MGLVLMFFLIPAFGLMLANLFFFISHFAKVSKTDLRNGILLGTGMACIGLLAMALNGNFYIFSFIVQSVLVFSLILFVSFIFYVKKDVVLIKRSLFINTTLFSGTLIFLIGLYLTRDLDWFYY